MNHDVFLLSVITPRTNELSWLKTLIESYNNQMCSNTFDTQFYVTASILFTACKFTRFIGNWV